MDNNEKLIRNRDLVLAECKSLFNQITAREVFQPGGPTIRQIQELIRKIDVLIYGVSGH